MPITGFTDSVWLTESEQVPLVLVTPLLVQVVWAVSLAVQVAVLVMLDVYDGAPSGLTVAVTV